MSDIVEYPEWIMLRDTMLNDDMGGLGQRIYTNAGSGYAKQKYIRDDVVEALRQQLADTTWQDNADYWQKRVVKAEQQLAECQAREKVLRDAIDTMLKQARHEALLEAAETFSPELIAIRFELRKMAKELA